MQAIRFHYRPVRYLWTRFAAARRPALALGATGCVTFDEVDPPALPGDEWVRISTALSGICGSDLSAITANDSFTLEPFGAYPFTFGHENVGVVDAVGAAAGSFQPGQRVIINPMLACRQRGLTPPCDACARGEYGLCRRTRDGVVGTGPMIGFCPQAGGGWSRYFVAHHSQLHDAGDLPDDVAVLTDPFASSLRPVLLHPPRADDSILVIGAGSIGALTVKALRLFGWRGDINVLGRYSFQLELAERAGATRCFRSRAEVYKWAGSLPGAVSYQPTLAPKFVEGGPSLVYDTVGSASSIADALALTREGGRMVLVGAAAKVEVDWTRIWYRQLSVAGVFAYGSAPYQGQQRDIYDVSIQLMRNDGLGELNMVTHVFPLEEYRAALSAALDKNGSRSVKVVFRPGD
ncbi:MAG TPA: alcohol dehydrogenase catalytic domain-containing protein [Longimicrobiales bacterium]|nr:alcohol dehydrogenase catalytic domain-containing protein [Longimicrobiales bacterium]